MATCASWAGDVMIDGNAIGDVSNIVLAWLQGSVWRSASLSWPLRSTVGRRKRLKPRFILGICLCQEESWHPWESTDLINKTVEDYLGSGKASTGASSRERFAIVWPSSFELHPRRRLFFRLSRSLESLEGATFPVFWVRESRISAFSSLGGRRTAAFRVWLAVLPGVKNSSFDERGEKKMAVMQIEYYSEARDGSGGVNVLYPDVWTSQSWYDIPVLYLPLWYERGITQLAQAFKYWIWSDRLAWLLSCRITAMAGTPIPIRF